MKSENASEIDDTLPEFINIIGWGWIPMSGLDTFYMDIDTIINGFGIYLKPKEIDDTL